MINRGGIGDLLLARKMAGLPTVQDVQTYAHGGETTIAMPQSLKELQHWKTPVSDKQLMENIFSDRLTGVEGAEPVAMPANVDELMAYMKTRRKGYADGGETDSDQVDTFTREAIYGGNFDLGNGYSVTPEGDVVSNTPGERPREYRDEPTYSGPISRFGTDVTTSNINATKTPTTSPSGNFDIYGGLGGGSSLISPDPTGGFTSTSFTQNPFRGPYVSPRMTAAEMEQNPVSSEFNYKAMESLNPWFQTKAASLLNTMMDAGMDPFFSSGSRTYKQQEGIYNNPSPYGAAPPGMSAHNFGQAFDIGGLTNKEMIQAGLMGEAAGLGWGGRFSTYDPVHFQEMGSSISPAKYAASVGAPVFKGASVGGIETAMNTRPEPFDVGKAISDRVTETFTPGGIGSLVLGAAIPPVGLYNFGANVLNMAGANLPTTTSMINQGLGVAPPEAPQAPVIPAALPARPISETPPTAVADIYTPSGPTTRGVYDPLANVEYTSGGPLTRSTTPASTQMAEAVTPQEQSWWDKLFTGTPTERTTERDNPMVVAQNTLPVDITPEEAQLIQKKLLYPIWPSSTEPYTGPYEKYLI